MGSIILQVVLSIFFFIVITPLGWMRRLIGSDPIAKHPSNDAATYRKERAKAISPQDMEKAYR